MNKITFYIAAIIALLSIQSCSNNIKRKLGLATPGPNEYEVSSNRPLEMPPHFNLEEIDNLKSSGRNDEANSKLNDAQKSLLKELEAQ